MPRVNTLLYVHLAICSLKVLGFLFLMKYSCYYMKAWCFTFVLPPRHRFSFLSEFLNSFSCYMESFKSLPEIDQVNDP